MVSIDNNVDFGSSSIQYGQATAIRFRYSCDHLDVGRIEVWADFGEPDQQRIARFWPTYTGSWHDWVVESTNLDVLLEGNHTLTLKGEGRKGIFWPDWFELKPDCFPIDFICIDDSDCCSNVCGTNGFCEQAPEPRSLERIQAEDYDSMVGSIATGTVGAAPILTNFDSGESVTCK